MALGKYSLAPAENKLYTIDYTQWLAVGETISAVVLTTAPVTAPPFSVSNQAISSDGLSLSFYAGGGIAGQTYEVTAQITTSLNQTKDDSVFYAVKNI